MPAFLTHWHILIETARQSQNAGSDLGSLIMDSAALRRRNHGWSTPPQTTPTSAIWDTGPLPEIDFRFPGSDISAMAFLGTLAPDTLFYHKRYLTTTLTDTSLQKQAGSKPAPQKPHQWSELFHTSRSGEILISFLEQLALVPSPALRTQALAFALGYVSHIAADIALNPWLRVIGTHLQAHRGLGPRFWAALRLDEFLATSYFEHTRYSLVHQPWSGYIEPAARNLSQTGTLAAQILQLLTIAAEIYELGEEQTEALPQDFLAGLRGMRNFLAGRGRACLLPWQTAQSDTKQDILSRILANTQNNSEILALSTMLSYAIRLSLRFCRRSIDYYTVLRNPNAEASERSSRRAALVSDLRNWNLYTGESADDISGSKIHNWEYFADLWEPDGEKRAGLLQQMMQTG
jgi:hypothetical protein